MTKINPAHNKQNWDRATDGHCLLCAGPKIVVIVGPTASGKSDLGIKLAKKFNGEIISADSRQVYKRMDIGTGKVKRDYRLPTTDYRRQSEFYSDGIRHHLIDIANPKKVFSVSDFKNLGEKALKEILDKDKIQFIVGGTGFYIDALVKNFSIPEVLPNKKLRAKLEKISTEDLFMELRGVDIKRAKIIDKNNKRHLIRALEIIKTTGKPIPALKKVSRYEVLYIGLNPPKDILENKIKLRLEKRLNQGMIREVKNLLKSGISKKRLYDFGLEYRWISEYLAGKISYAQMKDGLFRAIIKYSKRQMTWFKRNKEIHWVQNQKEAEKLIRKFIDPLP